MADEWKEGAREGFPGGERASGEGFSGVQEEKKKKIQTREQHSAKKKKDAEGENARCEKAPVRARVGMPCCLLLPNRAAQAARGALPKREPQPLGERSFPPWWEGWRGRSDGVRREENSKEKKKKRRQEEARRKAGH